MHSQLEQYLNEVADRLAPSPVNRRNEELREMRAHLLSVIEAYQELGETEQDAVTSALHQFGTPQEIGRAFRRHKIRSWRDTAKSGLLSAAALWSVLGLCTLIGHIIAEQSNALTMLLSSHLQVIYFTILFGFSALSGVLSPGRVTQATTGPTLWGTLAGYALPILIYEAFHAWTDTDVLAVAFLVSAQAACLTGAAWISIRWQQRHRSRATLPSTCPN